MSTELSKLRRRDYCVLKVGFKLKVEFVLKVEFFPKEPILKKGV